MIHTPAGCSTLEKVERQQIRLLLQSVFGKGKTFSAMTSPNPCVVNIDNNLGAHSGRADIINVKFYDKEFIRKYNSNGLVHLAISKWLQEEGMKLTEEQTLVGDGLTNLQNAYDREVGVPMSTKTGKEDLQAWWGFKLDWQKELFESFKSLKCNVIITCHEEPEYNEDGGVTGNVLPLVQGGFKRQIGTHFTDIFRQHAVSKPDLSKLSEADLAKTLTNFKMSKADYIKFIDSFEGNTMYLWQLQPDSVASCKTHLVNAPKFVRADWNIFNETDKTTK